MEKDAVRGRKLLEEAVEKGDVDSVWEKADYIVEGEYATGAQEQLYIEPNGMMAVMDPKEGLTVWGSLQCPYYVHKALMPLFEVMTDDPNCAVRTNIASEIGETDSPVIKSWSTAQLMQRALWSRASCSDHSK